MGYQNKREKVLNFNDYFQKCSENILSQHYTKIESKLKNDDSLEYDNSSMNTFKMLYQQCFNLHLNTNLEYITKETIQPSPIKAKEIFTNEKITNLFLSQYYKYPKVKTYSYNQNSQKYANEKNIEKDDVKDEILSDIANPGKIIFLTGNVGDGKSSLLHKFCIEASKTKEVDGWSYFPVLIDVQKILKKYKNIVDTNIFYSLILNQVMTTIEKEYKLPEVQKDVILEKKSNHNSLKIEAILTFKALIASFLTSSKFENIETTEKNMVFENIRKFDNPISKINQLAEKLDEQKIRMILIVDNLDTFSYSDERYMLFPNGFNKFKNNVYKAKDIVNEILINMEGSLISYIFTLRPYVQSHMFDSSTENPLDIEIASRTTLYEIDIDYTTDSKDIFLSRIDLLYDLSELIQNREEIGDKKRKNILEIAKKYQEKVESLKSNKKDKISRVFSDFYDITNQGYRSIVLFYKNLEYNQSLFDRYFTHDVLHLYKLDFFEQYSQVLPSKIENKIKNYYYPNIFLVVCNTEFNKDSIDSHVCEPNHFTYWLKYIILLYLYENENVTLLELINHFSKKRAIGHYYDEHAVKLTVGSLGTINEYNCIQYGFDSNNLNTLEDLIKNTKVYLTNRGKKIIENNSTFAFYNLQYFIDDWLLPKPRYDRIGIERLNISHSYSYEYLLGERKYTENLNKITIEKAKQSIIFLFYLEYSFIHEKNRYANVWYLLENKLEGNFIFEENFFSNQRNAVLAFIKTQIHDKKAQIEITNFLKNFKQYEVEINKFFTKVYTSSMLVKCS
jgi:hypothetical protein